MTQLKTQSSFAVQPELVLGKDQPVLRRVNGYLNEIRTPEGSLIDHDEHVVQVRHLTESIIRVCIGEPLHPSFAVRSDLDSRRYLVENGRMEWTWLPDAHWQVGYHRHGTGLSTSRGLYVDDRGHRHLFLRFDNLWPVYGLGEKTGELNKANKRWTFWNSDVFEPHTEATDALYQSIPFFMTRCDQGYVGVFLDNPGRVVFDFSLDNELCITVETGAIDLYVITGNHYSDILNDFTQLTGRPFLPPKWALGYHQSKHSYESEQQVLDLVDNFARYNIPCDAIYLDILYMNEYRVFSFDIQRYPNAPQFVESLADKGIKVVPIVDPGIKVDKHNRLYCEGVEHNYFVKDSEGKNWQGQVWPGESVWPDFMQPEVRNWWRDQHQFYTDIGVQGVWNDMNEPAVFNDRMTIDADAMHWLEGDWITHESVHNAYGLLMCRATAEAIVEQCQQRPFVLTRAGYAGIQKYAAVWTGDNRSSWSHLRYSIPMLLNLGMSGVSFTGADIGGFMDDSRPELFLRWMQLGAFYPLMRNHCSIGQRAQEPWAFGEPWTSRVRSAIERRYRLMPYLYQLFRDAHETGLPILRPMTWQEPDNKQLDNVSDQFMVGQDILVAPIMEPGQRARAVYLPEGQWLNLHTGLLSHGGGYALVETQYDDIPVFLRAGAVLPLSDVRQNTVEPMQTLRLLVIDGAVNARILYRDDDGITVDPLENKYVRVTFGYQKLSSKLECHLMIDHSHYRPEWRSVVLGLPKAWNSLGVFVNGIEVGKKFEVDDMLCRIEYVEPNNWI